ncbi:hypothetical protein MCHIJ_16130 [Mycolicibacterium chitae]|uniref:Uncharacterized protein, copper resistance protein CopC-like protein n=1 Tax=Mycolicibacterium chitae TaxID=1792 RepID=A0A3S4RHZ0_MYCCI|nr:copper resistance CopC family protein [Mycolicibacterium chitae]MCV7106832.1 copper resistance protein CopC [Mycolicibacterium chitae]BBZ02176.1 hypothetical protein MCHIJ_16130 [Mycolicibacterium chitae]VEG44239.1 uncharacterized protein, copper resistance protein CopC-like protein [Mycolicibacterium chitae]
MISVALRRSRAAARAGVLAVLVALLTFAGTAVAGAHATLIGTDPADGTSLPAGPQRVSATFNEDMQPTFAAMTVVGPDGTMWADGDPVVEGPVISVGVRPLGPAGTYTVNYRATSADGHVVTGAWSFEVTAAGAGDPAPQPVEAPEASDSSLPVWPFAVAAILVVAAAVVWAVRRRT